MSVKDAFLRRILNNEKRYTPMRSIKNVVQSLCELSLKLSIVNN